MKYVTKARILVDTWTRDRVLGTVPLEIHILSFLRNLPHRNLCEMVSFFEDDKNYYVEMTPFGRPGTDLFDWIELHTAMTESEAKSIFHQTCAAIEHLHTECGIVHRDIKDENVVLDSAGRVKVIDFGSAAYLKDGPFDTFHGTLDYASPEVLGGKKYTGPAQDVWAAGILLYTMIYKENPFYNVLTSGWLVAEFRLMKLWIGI
jgi:protein-serine/threonine kinase